MDKTTLKNECDSSYTIADKEPPKTLLKEPSMWKITSKEKKDFELKSKLFDDFLVQKQWMKVDKYAVDELRWKKLQAVPTYDNFLKQLSELWRDINGIATNDSVDDSGICYNTVIVESGQLIKTDQARITQNVIHKEAKSEQQCHRNSLKEKDFCCTRHISETLLPEKEPCTEPSQIALNLQENQETNEVLSSDLTKEEKNKEPEETLMNEHHIQKTLTTVEQMSKCDSDNNVIITEESDSLDDISIIFYKNNVSEQPEAHKQIPQTENTVAESIKPPEIKVECWNGIPEFVIIRGSKVVEETPTCTESTSKIPTVDTVASLKFHAATHDLNNALKLPPINSGARKRPVEENEPPNAKKSVPGGEHCELRPITLSSDSDISVISFIPPFRGSDEVFKHDELSDMEIVDEDSDSESDTQEDLEMAAIFSAENRWRMRPVSRIAKTRTSDVLLYYKLPIQTEEDKWRRFDPRYLRLEPVRIPLYRLPTHSPNDNRCTMFLKLGLKGPNVITVKLYQEYPHLSIADQRRYNRSPTLDDYEVLYARQHIIQQYGNVPVENFILPTNHPYDGLYWPVFQPIDAVTQKQEFLNQLLNADVQNQLVNQTVCNYTAKKHLLCDDGSGFWDTTYKEGYYANSVERTKPRGRFAGRVGFARDVCPKDERRARENDARRTASYRAEVEQQREEQKRWFLEEHDLKDGDDIPGAFLAAYKEACRSTNLNERLKWENRDVYALADNHRDNQGRRRRNPFMDDWFQVPRWQYVPANDRRTFLCKYINHYNVEVVERCPPKYRYRELVEWIGAACTAAFADQHKNNFMKLTDKHFELAKERSRKIEATCRRGSMQSLRALEELCEMQPWEWNYWPFIWDSLSSIYKILPPVSHLALLMRSEIDMAFRRVGQIGHREVYFKTYTENKNRYMQEKRRQQFGR